MITYKINKHIKVQKHLNNGLKMTIEKEGKYTNIKFSKYELKSLKFIIICICNDYERNSE